MDTFRVWAFLSDFSYITVAAIMKGCDAVTVEAYTLAFHAQWNGRGMGRSCHDLSSYSGV